MTNVTVKQIRLSAAELAVAKDISTCFQYVENGCTKDLAQRSKVYIDRYGLRLEVLEYAACDVVWWLHWMGHDPKHAAGYFKYYLNEMKMRFHDDARVTYTDKGHQFFIHVAF